MSETEDNPVPPEAEALFVVTVNGPAAGAEVVPGLEAAREAILRAVWRGAQGAAPEDLGARLEALDDPGAWVPHGLGDGRPFWHWWAALGEGSVSVQRITLPLPEDPRVRADQSAGLRRTAAALAACAEELRQAAQAADGSLRFLQG